MYMPSSIERKKLPVIPEELTALILEANRILVTTCPVIEKTILFESGDKKDLEALSTALIVTKPDHWLHCMCVGSPAIYLYKNDKLLAQVTNHHGLSVRCSLWSSDAPIADIENWLQWFDERQINGPRYEVEEARRRQEQSERDWKKWTAAIPNDLKGIWESAFDDFGFVDTEVCRDAWKHTTADKEEQILELLAWFGSGEGPWSGFPPYEEAAEELLLDYEIEDIVSVIDFEKMTPAQIEGVARLFGGWTFSQRHPEGLNQVPRETKQMLWNHVKNTKDKDKLGRAQQAFE